MPGSAANRSADGATRTTCSSGKPASTYTGSASRTLALPERERQHRRGEQQQAGAEDLGAEAEPGEVAVGAVARPVGSDVDQRRHDEQQQELDEVDAELERRHAHEQREPQAAREIAHEIGGVVAQDQRASAALGSS